MTIFKAAKNAPRKIPANTGSTLLRPGLFVRPKQPMKAINGFSPKATNWIVPTPAPFATLPRAANNIKTDGASATNNQMTLTKGLLPRSGSFDVEGSVFIQVLESGNPE